MNRRAEAPLYEVTIQVPGDRSWCVEQQAAIRERLQTSTIVWDCLPAVSVEGDPAQLVLKWIELPFASGGDALAVAETTAADLLPGFKDLPFVRLEWGLQDPDGDRRRPVG